MRKAIFMSFLLFAAFLSLGLSLPKVSSTSIPKTPIGTTIPVTSNETFVLAYEFVFDQTEPGFFMLAFYWDNNESDPNAPYFNLTYESFEVKFTDGRSFPVPVSVAIMKGSAPGLSGVYRYTVAIDESSGDNTENGAFWVNVTMRAAGVVGGSYFPRAGGNPNITCSSTFAGEAEIVQPDPPSGDCTVHVKPRIMACDSAGVPKKVFDVNLGEDAYAKGFGFVSKASGIRVYVRPNSTWTDQKSIGDDIRGTSNYNTTNADLAGKFLIRLGTLPPPYPRACDIVADTDKDKRYDEYIDAVDDATIAPGIVVVPEFPYGTAILTMIATLAATLVVLRVRKRKSSLLPLF